jgi:hypothetical protein
MKAVSDCEMVQRQLVSAISAIAPTDRGAVLVIENGLDELRAALGIERN